MTSDPSHLAQVSIVMQRAVREARDLVEAGDFGAPLRDVVRHARELHDILVGELATGSRYVGEYADGALVDMGDRLRMLEQYLNAH